MTLPLHSHDANPPAKAELDWLDVTRRMQQGDTGALEIYYEQFFELMFREVRRLANRDEATSLDLVQDAMLKAIRCIKPLPTGNSVAAWTRTVAKSVTYDWLRKQLRQNSLSESLQDDVIVQKIQTESDDEGNVRLLWIEEQLKSLPSDLQRLISFRYRWGWSLQKIAETLGLKTGAVDGRLRRAVSRLQAKAKSEFDEND